MKKAFKIWLGMVMAFIAVGAVVGGIKFDGGAGSYFVAVVAAAAALRTWYLAGSTKPPTEVEG